MHVVSKAFHLPSTLLVVVVVVVVAVAVVVVVLHEKSNMKINKLSANS